MGYGAQAKRVPAKGQGIVVDADVFKLGIVGKFKRGLASVQTGLYSMDDVRKVCGNATTSSNAWLVLRALYQHLRPGVTVESKILMHVANDAVQAGYAINDGATTKVFDFKAGAKGEVDKSAGGNDIAIKISQSESVTFKLTADTDEAPTVAYLDQINNLEVGYQVKFADGTNTEYAFITAIDAVTKKITFAALTNDYTAALTTVSRCDWNLFIAVKDDYGSYQQQESYLDIPYVKSSTKGMIPLVNNAVSGSFYGILTLNDANSTTGANARPAALASWTPLTGGSNGTAANDASWNSLVAGLADEHIQILLAPESSSPTHNNNMATFTTSGYKALYFGQASNGATEDVLKNLGGICSEPIKFGMLPIDKWFETDDPTKDGGKIQIPPVGHAAAHWFNNYSVYGASKVAAGNRDALVTSDRLLDSNGLIHDDVNGKGDRLIRKYRINIARYRQGKGITINSARTWSTDTGYQFQNQIMQWLLYKVSILDYLRSIEQDKAGVRAQEDHYNAIWSYMIKKYDAGEFFQGQREDGTPTEFQDVVQIVNDFTVNTLADIANGIENNFVQFIAPPPIEEPILSLASAPVTMVKG
ncbi:hypothetical protein [Leptospira idonii]|uniref:Phage tail protein n=1 Tax=Leptospira idonii TaxID=1193500 RepID=A0A4R9M4Z9_9LEPT|nr:hypothetical protein [Leptospira idonii]TGN20787.1 hypothetical protein EHS15_01760 [Leptospira idonii]